MDRRGPGDDAVAAQIAPCSARDGQQIDTTVGEEALVLRRQQCMHQLRRDSADALVALHALLGGEVAALDVSRGRLRIAFAQGHEVLVDPVLDDQAWALSFEAGGSITCAADGKVDVRMP